VQEARKVAARLGSTGGAAAAKAHALAAGGLVGLERLESAAAHLEHGTRADPDEPLLHHVHALWHHAARRQDPSRDPAPGLREAEAACRLAPEAWEPHAMLATLLAELPPAPRRAERRQFHAVRALELGAPPPVEGALLFQLGITSVQAGKLDAASKLFVRLLEDPGYRARAQYWLGVVNHQYGRYKNAVLYLRQHIDQGGDDPRVHGRLAMAYLRLGELGKARESANRALAADPADHQARWTLGSTFAEEGRTEDAIRTFRSILEDAPDHLPAFEALVGVHASNVGWLRAALRGEVKGFDRLPLTHTEGDRSQYPRQAVRRRIEAVLAGLRGCAEQGNDGVGAILDAMDLTTDEGLRFLLWENVLDHVSAQRAAALSSQLQAPGRVFSAAAGREALALARAIPEELLVRGLQIDEEDLRRAAVERGGATRDVTEHRKAIDAQRREARAWQALLLLAIASHGNRASRNLLVRWAADADPDLGDAARAALAMLGDEEATAVLAKRVRARGAQNLLDAMLAQVAAPTQRSPVRGLLPGEDRACTTCGRRAADVTHMMVGGSVAVCDRCLGEIAQRRRELETDDAEAVCALSGRGRFETAAMYVFQGLTVCREVVDHGLGLLEREVVDGFLDQL
ncbi:MAG: tetratricopeptide repeat protein, partial [Myxococcota bacterium]